MQGDASRFAIPGHVEIAVGQGGLGCLQLASSASAATVYLHGGQVTGFTRHGEPPLLFLSERARFAPGQAIRGGIPVIFPWFGNREGLPAHGFARTTPWRLAASGIDASGSPWVTLTLDEAPPSIAWPKFAVRYTITIAERLSLELEIDNLDEAHTTRIEHCLHTYLSVGDVRAAAITGLSGRPYLDKVDGVPRKVDPDGPIRIAAETDRVYRGASGPLTVDDPVLARRIRIETGGTSSAVVWNPWVEKSKGMSDLDPAAYLRFLCVESGNVGDDAVVLGPGASSRSRVEIASAPR